MATIKVDVVSAEESIFSGDAELVSLPVSLANWVFCLGTCPSSR